MKKINTDVKYLSLIWIVLALLVIPTFAHHGNLILDCGREVYYPTQILLGKVLYKDLFNLYGPFSYMLNALLFKIFGVNLNVLYASGIVCAGLISNLIYLISKHFLPRFLSFSVAIFTISIGVLNVNLFNFIFPYSYAALYGLLAFLISFWILLKYVNSPEKKSYLKTDAQVKKSDYLPILPCATSLTSSFAKAHRLPVAGHFAHIRKSATAKWKKRFSPLGQLPYLYLSCFFAGLSFTNKYEFLPYLIVVLYSIIKIKPLKLKEYYYSILSILFIPIFCFGILFLQGLRINDLISTFAILNKIAHSQTLKYFYTTQGVTFSHQTLPFLIASFLKTVLPLGILLWGFKNKNKFLSFCLISISVCAMAFLVNPASFAFFPLLIIILAILNFKKLKHNKALLILTLSAILVSLKSFWGLATLNYGVFFISFLLIAVLALLSDKFKAKDINFTAVGIYILIISVILGYQNLLMLKDKNQLISTPRGKIYTTEYLSSATNDLINYIKINTKKTDTIVVFPEGPFINFLTDRKSDNYYNSLIPLYVEVFGEEKLIQHFEKTKPDYIIFNNWDNKDYSVSYICTDYAVSFCNFIAKNYTQEKVIDKGFRYLIFKSK